MKALYLTALSLGLAASAVWGASLPATSVRGQYVEARTADVYTGPCFANSEAGQTGNLAVFGWKIDQGTWQGVDLNGLSVVGVVRAGATLGDQFANPYPAKSVLIVDDKATVEQRMALKAFAQQMGGQLLENIVRVEYQPISLIVKDGNVHSGVASLTAGNLATVQTRALDDADHICHNEEVWYQPLTKLDHAMPAYTLAQGYSGKGLNTDWNYSDKRASFVGTFHYAE
ncbi:MAG: DUF1326 domain-containing protein [Bryobacteraceae bacterium]